MIFIGCRQQPTLQNDSALKRHPIMNPVNCAWFSMEEGYDRQCMSNNHTGFLQSQRKAYKATRIEEALHAAGESLRIDSQRKVNVIVQFVMDRGVGALKRSTRAQARRMPQQWFVLPRN